MKHIVIIGNGISGITAARHIRKRSRDRITIVSSETRHFFSRTALMYVYMGHLKFEHTKPYEDWFWEKNKLDLVYDRVVKVDAGARSLVLQSGSVLAYDVLIIASGSRSNFLNVPGSHATGMQSLYGYPDLQQLEQNTRGVQHAVIAGGGLIGIEMAEMLLSRNIHVTFVVREPEFWSNVLPKEEARMIGHHIRSHGVDLRLNTQLTEILADANGRVRAAVTDRGESIPCTFLALTVGVSPAVDFLAGSGIACHRGVLVDAHLRTNVPDVFAIGDCAEQQQPLPGRKSIEQVWYTGRMMGEAVAQTICGNLTAYDPGPWYNSAKFFDIEYQTYGNVPAAPEEGGAHLYWQHASGKKAVHMVWDKNTRDFLGVNTFGIRMRHETFDRWLRGKKSIDFVMAHLAEANFDPEFFRRHEAEIRAQFGRVHTTQTEPA